MFKENKVKNPVYIDRQNLFWLNIYSTRKLGHSSHCEDELNRYRCSSRVGVLEDVLTAASIRICLKKKSK